MLLGTEIDDSGIPGLLAREQDGELELRGRRSSGHASAAWAEKFAAMSIEKPALKGLRRANKAQSLKAEPGQGADPKAKGMLRDATVRALIEP